MCDSETDEEYWFNQRDGLCEKESVTWTIFSGSGKEGKNLGGGTRNTESWEKAGVINQAACWSRKIQVWLMEMSFYLFFNQISLWKFLQMFCLVMLEQY